MKIVSFNVNSIRVRLHQLARVIDKHAPEFIGLQETKVQDHEFPIAEIEALGYQVIYMGQKTHYGVALLSKAQNRSAWYGLPNDSDETQKRFIGGEYDVDGKPVIVFNGYFPQGESRDHPLKFPAKTLFYKELNGFLSSFDMNNTSLIVMGDYNIAPQDIDIGIGEDNARRWLKTGKTSFLPEEREWFFSWFDYRSKGFEREPKRGLRIDHLLVSEKLRPMVIDAGVDYDIRAMHKPSDHAPTWIELKPI
jgi:exodeoxyribonuclease-3